jgi:chitinase
MLLFIVVSADSQNYKKLKLADMTIYLNFFNIMTFDYVDFCDIVAAHQINIYSCIKNNSRFTSFFTDAVINDYINADVSIKKINLSMSLYDRVFQRTNDMRRSFHDVDEDSFEKRIWDYKDLSQADVVKQMNQQWRISYSWNESKRLIVSYDIIATSNLKVDYIKKNKLDDGMFWELSEDRKKNDSLVVNVNFLIMIIVTVVNANQKLDLSWFEIHWTESKFKYSLIFRVQVRKRQSKYVTSEKFESTYWR